MTTTTLESVKAKIAAAQAQLDEQLAALQTSEDWRRTLERMALLGPLAITRFSFRNILLLVAQRQSIRHAATFNTWRTKGRSVRKGEKGLMILRPRFVKEEGSDEQRLAGFSYLTVFDLEQTDGEPLPEPLRPRQVSTPEAFGWTFDAMRELVKSIRGVNGITLRARQPIDNPNAAGWFDLRTHHIVVIAGESPEAHQLKTLLHEVAHAVLHGDGEHHATPTAEVEAESTAFVVAHALGLDTSGFSLPYVATWALAGDEKEPTRAVANVGERVRNASGVILRAIFGEPELADAA
ncbi:MAG: ArdC-like ssDNA-binding domain-containing protein [Archangium sp.]